jgi:hypothetical protein
MTPYMLLLKTFDRVFLGNKQTSTNKTDSEIQALHIDKPNKHIHIDDLGHFLTTEDVHCPWKWESMDPNTIVENVFLPGSHTQKQYQIQ